MLHAGRELAISGGNFAAAGRRATVIGARKARSLRMDQPEARLSCSSILAPVINTQKACSGLYCRRRALPARGKQFLAG